MRLKEKDSVYIQSFKHDGSLHRTWATGFVIEANEKRIVAVTDHALVSEADGRRWVTKEPAVCFFYPDRWYNVICMIRKGGVHYYCNIASPSLVDEEAIKNIDYDLDVKIFPNGKFIILDEDEYQQHSRQMQYSQKLDVVIRQGLQNVLNDIALKKSPFDKKTKKVKKVVDNKRGQVVILTSACGKRVRSLKTKQRNVNSRKKKDASPDKKRKNAKKRKMS